VGVTVGVGEGVTLLVAEGEGVGVAVAVGVGKGEMKLPGSGTARVGVGWIAVADTGGAPAGSAWARSLFSACIGGSGGAGDPSRCPGTVSFDTPGKPDSVGWLTDKSNWAAGVVAGFEFKGAIR
jgi:hypothetical protein